MWQSHICLLISTFISGPWTNPSKVRGPFCETTHFLHYCVKQQQSLKNLICHPARSINKVQVWRVDGFILKSDIGRMSLIVYKWKQSQLQNIRKLQFDPFPIVFPLSNMFELCRVPLQILLILITNVFMSAVSADCGHFVLFVTSGVPDITSPGWYLKPWVYKINK